MFHFVFPANLFFFLLKCFVFRDNFFRKGKIQKNSKYKKREREKNPGIKKKERNKRYKDLTI